MMTRAEKEARKEEVRSAPVSALPTGPWTISICLDIEGIDAETASEALAQLKEGLSGLIPTWAAQVTLSPHCHVMPTSGRTVELETRDGKQVHEVD